MIRDARKSRWPVIGSLPMVIVLALGGVNGCSESQQPNLDSRGISNGVKGATEISDRPEPNNAATAITLTPEAVRKYAIKTDLAEARMFTATIVTPGEVSFDTERISQVGSAVTGRVVELKVRVGDQVNKGDDLVIVDSPELGAAQSDHLQKRTAVEVATPAIALAKSSYDRAKHLAVSETVSLSELQRREGELKAAEGNLQMAASAVTASVSRLLLLGMDEAAIARLEAGGKIDSKFVIRAPITGQVVERAVTLGELVNPGKESLITVVDLSSVWVLADVPQARLDDVRVGAAARVKAGNQPVRLEGKVSFIPPQLDANTRTARVRIVVKNESRSLRAGMFCEVDIAATDQTKPSPEAVIVIPEEAVQSIDGAPSIFVPVEGQQNAFMRKRITVGRAAGGKVIVEKGLSAGQPYVSSGTFTLKAELGKSTIEE